MSPARKRAAIRHLQTEGLNSQRRGRLLVGLSRSILAHRPRRRPDEEALRARIKQLGENKKRYGCRRIWGLLWREGCPVNHERAHGPAAVASRLRPT